MARRSAFRRALSTLVMVPATIILIVFAVSNRAEVMLSFWPLSEGVATPLYLLVLALFILGALVGMVLTWASGSRTRRELRETRRRAERAEREAADLRARQQRLETPPPGARKSGEATGRSLVTTV
jgi:uncharacterized integral membrane protein